MMNWYATGMHQCIRPRCDGEGNRCKYNLSPLLGLSIATIPWGGCAWAARLARRVTSEPPDRHHSRSRRGGEESGGEEGDAEMTMSNDDILSWLELTATTLHAQRAYLTE